MRDAAVWVSGAGGHSEGGERAARLAAHVRGAYAGRRRLPRMLHGAARELRPYDETDAFGCTAISSASCPLDHQPIRHKLARGTAPTASRQVCFASVSAR